MQIASHRHVKGSIEAIVNNTAIHPHHHAVHLKVITYCMSMAIEKNFNFFAKKCF